MGRMPTRFFIEGERHLAAFAHDLFAHPELQASGAGFFTTMRLYKTVEDACDSFAGLLWTNQINIKLQQARKYDQLWVRRHARPLEISTHVRRRLPSAPDAAVDLVGRLSRHAIGLGDWVIARARRGPPVERILRADERFDRLAERAGPKLGIAPVKDAAYVAWKYFDWPYLPATVLGVTEGRDLRGFVVLRSATPRGTGRVLDLVADPGDEETLDALVAATLSHYRAQRASSVECIATSPSIAAALKRSFFAERLPETPLFFLNGHKAPKVESLRRLENWAHVYGDSEGGETP
jgi:hypothetical protein